MSEFEWERVRVRQIGPVLLTLCDSSCSTDGNRYTPTSGIWQTVWLEQVPPVRIERLRVLANMTTITVSAVLLAGSRSTGGSLQVTVSADGVAVGKGSAPLGSEANVVVPSPRLWSPNDPFLYNVTVLLLATNGTVWDRVATYTGMRSVSLGPAQGISRAGIPATPGLNWPGGDLPRMPIHLNQSATAAVCEAMCNTTSACKAWAYGVSHCGHAASAAPLCWLKSTVNWSKEQRDNECRVSGAKEMDPSSHNTTMALYLNGAPIFAAGWLDQCE